MEDIIPSVRKVVDAVEIQSPHVFVLNGRKTVSVTDTSPGAMVSPLVQHLQFHLYHAGYCHKMGDEYPEPEPPAPPEQELIERLRHANAGQARWEQGWVLQSQLPSGSAVARKGDIVRTFPPGSWFIHQQPGHRTFQEVQLTAYLSHDSLERQPGFYFAFGDTLLSQEEDRNHVRFYWNTSANQVHEVVRVISTAMNRYQIPFILKCFNQKQLYHRFDSIVLYVIPRFRHFTGEVLARVYQHIQEWLQADTPLFTKRIAPGFALAEDPGSGTSFGHHRCGLIASGLWEAFRQKVDTTEEKLELIHEQFRQHNLQLTRPYLGPRGRDDYEFHVEG